MRFPENFIWGTSMSAHQTEGNNTNCDWWRWEKEKDNKRELPLETSGECCDSYNRYDEEFEFCKTANNNAVRISIEWARIEPREGIFDNKAIDHYKKVLTSAKEKGLLTFVTLHHFTNPQWFSEKGGWTLIKSPETFEKYAKKCSAEFSDLIDYYITINEPQVYASMSYLTGVWPPNKKSLFLSVLVQINLARAHNKAYKALKTSGKNVGLVKNIAWYEYSSFTVLDKWLAKLLFYLNSDFFLNLVKKNLDFIGLNYYFTNRVVKLKIRNPDEPVNDLGWWINYEGLYKILVSLKKYNLPIYITENGLADEKDTQRTQFIKKMLSQAYQAINKGVKLKGYFYWSLIDNFEWHHGFWPKFGLIEIDRNNGLTRKPRKSFYDYAKICKNGEVE